MYQHINNIISIPAKLLYEDLGLMTINTYASYCRRGKLIRTQRGCNTKEAYVSFESLPNAIKKVVTEAIGEPKKHHKQAFEDFITKDDEASKFFRKYTTATGEALPEKNIKEYTCHAEILNAIRIIFTNSAAKRQALGSKPIKPWSRIIEIIQDLPLHKYPHTMPTSERRLKDRYKMYINQGYESLIHSGFGAKNAERLCDEAKSWVLARWCDQVKKCTGYNQLLKEYNQIAPDNNWKPLKSEQTLINYLTHPHIQPIWEARRYGELKFKEKRLYQHTTKLPSMRDSLWYSDGTKLNLYYQDENGEMKTTQVYEVIDTYSEVFLGYHISDKENFEAQYLAFKMAIQIAGHKPYEIRFDNQGGTKKLEATSFLGKLARLTTRTQPYNGKSKTIEYIFGRFQQDYLKDCWFFTGQNIQAKKQESKPNMELILANKKSLPTLEEIKKIYAEKRKQWNQAPHPKTGKPRLEMYLNSYNELTPKIEIWDMIDMFWITREKPITCTAYGIMMKHQKQEYNYMVMNDDRMPDTEWLSKNVDKKFIIKYDPDDLTIVQLFEDTPLGLKRVAAAELKTEIHRGKQEQLEGEGKLIAYVNAKNKEIREKNWAESHAVLEKHNMTPEDYGLISPKIKGISKKKHGRASKENKPTKSIGQHEKDISNLVQTDVNVYDLV